MGLFIDKQSTVDAKAKDAVIRLLYAYDKSVVPTPDQNVKAAPFRNTESYTPTDQEKDIENAIRNIKNSADFAYANSIVQYLFLYDYIGKAKTAKDVTYYGLTKTGKQFFENNGFEKNLREERRESSENFYKWTTLLVAFGAIVIPIMYNVYFDRRDDLIEPVKSIRVSIDSLNQSIKELKRQPRREIQATDSIRH